MQPSPLDPVVRHIRRLADGHSAAELTDGQLLRRFAAGRDPAALEALVGRHGPLVLGVCRRVLGRRPEAEDAFQATFLVLVRKAAALDRRGSLAPWLHAVAHRTALRARAAAGRLNYSAAPPEPAASAYPGHRDAVNALAFVAGGGLASAGEDGALCVWDANCKERSRAEAHHQGTKALTVSPDGRTVVTAGGDGKVRVWDAATGKEVRQLSAHAGGI